MTPAGTRPAPVTGDHGLDATGVRHVRLAGGWTAVVCADAVTVRIGYVDSGGEYRTALPASVQAANAAELATLREQAEGIGDAISAERGRLAVLLASGRRWAAGEWRGRYLDHPVTGRITRTLIWVFRAADGTEVTGIPCGETAGGTGALMVITAAGDVTAAPPDAEVRLWHPARAAAAEVAAWRELFSDLGWTQPVIQAFHGDGLPVA